MNHGSLFSGIGGFELAAQWMGWENRFHCEINPFGRKVLNYYWPKSKSYEDITKTDFTIWRGRIDILTGGFPCQPFSTAGKRKGTEDERHLWPEMLRAIREISPRWIVGENVHGIVSWNGGMVFEQVCSDLEAEGYEVQPVILPACGVNAPHRRDRIWFIAHANLHGHELRGLGEDRQTEGEGIAEKKEWKRVWNDNRGNGESGITTHATIQRRESRQQSNGRQDSAKDKGGMESKFERFGNVGIITHTDRPGKQRFSIDSRASYLPGQRWLRIAQAWNARNVTNWDSFPTQSPVCTGNDGLSPELDGITVSRHRSESIKAAGNAVVPQVAYQIFQAIESYDRTPRT